MLDAGRHGDREAQAPSARPAHPDRAGDPRAPWTGDWDGRLRLGRPLLERVRDRGDPAHPGPRRDERAPHGRADLARDRALARDRGGVVPADDPGLPGRRRRLHRDPREPRDLPEPGGGGGPLDGLCAHGVRQRGGGHRRDHLRRVRSLSLPGRAVRARGHGHHRRQPTRRPGVGTRVRGADLRLHHRVRVDDRLGARGMAERRRPRRQRGDRGDGATRHGGAHRVPGAPGVRLRLRGAHRHRGRVGRGPRLPAARGPERPSGPRHARDDPDHLLHRDHLPRPHVRPHSCGAGDGQLAAGSPRLRRAERPLLRGAGHDHADPGPGRQHELRGFPTAVVVHGAGPVHASPVLEPWGPPGVLQRHPHPRDPERGPAGRVQWRHPRADPAVRGRRVRLLHAVPAGDGPVLDPSPTTPVAVAGHPERRRGRGHRRRHASSSRPRSSRTAPGS